MSLATLEREIVGEARVVLKNPKLRLKDLLEWSTGDIKTGEGEVTIRIGAGLNVNATFPAACDKR